MNLLSQLYIIYKFKDQVISVLIEALQCPGASLQVNIGQVDLRTGIQPVTKALNYIIIQSTVFYFVHKNNKGFINCLTES